MIAAASHSFDCQDLYHRNGDTRLTSVRQTLLDSLVPGFENPKGNVKPRHHGLNHDSW